MKKLLALVLTFLLVVSCANVGMAEAAKEKIVFRTSTGSERPTTFDPTNVQSAGSMHFVLTAYEPLVNEVVGTTELEPCLATEWENPDAMTYIFKLRENVPFFDGNIMTAEDVVYSYERAMSFASAVSGLVSEIASVEAKDDMTVEIKLKSANSGFLYNVAKIGIVSKAFCQTNEKNGDFGAEACYRATCGTGAYQVSNYVEDQYYIMSRFDDYWRGWYSDRQIDEIQCIQVQDDVTMIQMLLSGELDKGHLMLTNSVEEMENAQNMNLYMAPSLQCNIFTMNTQKYPLDNLLVRKAISLAFDYEGAAQGIYGGNASVPHGFLSTKFADNNPEIPEQRFDLEEAKRLIDESGLQDIRLDIHVLGMADLIEMATMLQANLKKIGVTLNITQTDWVPLAEEHTNPENAPHMSSLCMGAFIGDAVSYMRQSFDSVNSGGSYNWSFYENEQFDNYMKLAMEATDSQARTKAIYDAQKLLVEDCPAIFCVNPMQIEAINSNWEGFEMHPTDYFWYVRFYNLTKK